MAASRSTCSDMQIHTPADARVIFHAVHLGLLPMVTRRLDNEERALIAPGCVYVWEERGGHADTAGNGIERWTDGIRWGPSRVRDGFLFYQQKQDENVLYSATQFQPPSAQQRNLAARNVLTKQTYTVNVDLPGGKKKWHLIAYFTDAALPSLRNVSDVPELTTLRVPHEKYKTARLVKGRPEHIFNPSTDSAPRPPTYTRLEYIPYNPQRHSPSSSAHRSSSPINSSQIGSSPAPSVMPISSPPSSSYHGRREQLQSRPSPQSHGQTYMPDVYASQAPFTHVPPDTYYRYDHSQRHIAYAQPVPIHYDRARAMPPLSSLRPKGGSSPLRSSEDERALNDLLLGPGRR